MIKSFKTISRILGVLSRSSSRTHGTLMSQPLMKLSAHSHTLSLDHKPYYHFTNQSNSNNRDNSLKAAQLLEQKGYMLLTTNNIDEAVLQFQNALKIRKNLSAKENEDLTQIYEGVKGMISDSKHPEQVLTLEIERLEVLKSAAQNDKKTIADCHRTIGNLLVALYRKNEAKGHLLQAAEFLESDTKNTVKNIDEFLEVTNNLIQVGDYNRALEISAIICTGILEKGLSNERLANAFLNNATACYYIAALSNSQELMSAALMEIEMAVQYFEKLDSTHKNYPEALILHGGIMATLNEYGMTMADKTETAEQFITKGLELLSARNDPRFRDLNASAVAHDRLTIIYMGRRDYNKCLLHQQKLYTYCVELGDTEDHLLKIEGNIAALHTNLRRYDEAFLLFGKVLNKFKEQKIRNKDFVEIYQIYGTTFVASNKIKEGVPTFKEIIKLRKEYAVPEDERDGYFNYFAGIGSLGLQQEKDAYDFFKVAAPILEKHHGAEHSAAKISKKMISDLGQKLNL